MKPAIRSALRHVRQALATLWLAFGIGLVMLASLDMAAGGLLAWWFPEDPVGLRLEPELEQEMTLASRATQPAPYVYYRGRPLKGRHCHSDQAGFRETWRPPHSAENGSADAAEGPRMIWFLGGSTMWGWGVADDETIPSYVAKQLYSEGGPSVEVRNLATLGWVSRQEALELAELTLAGQHPDIVVFYDGFNDLYAALANGMAGTPMSYFTYVDSPVANALHGTHLWHAAQLLGAGVGAYRSAFDDENVRVRLAREAIERYAESLRLDQMLANEYGFECLFLLQPTIFSKQSLSPLEQGFLANEHGLNVGARLFLIPPERIRDFYREAYGLTARRDWPANFRDLSQVFADDHSTRYLDYCHLTAEGNRRVAEEIVIRLRPLLRDTGTQ